MAYFPCNMAKTDGTATASQILKDYTAWANGYKITGTMANNGAVAQTITPSTSDQGYTVPAGYHNGGGRVTVPSVTVNIPDAQWMLAGTNVNAVSNGTTLAYRDGTMTNYGSQIVTSGTAVTDTDTNYIDIAVPANGYYDVNSKIKVANSLIMWTPTLLWTNPDSGASFPPQTIALDLTNYTAVMISFTNTYGRIYFNKADSGATYIGAGCTIGYGSSNQGNYTRNILSISDSGIQFDNCYHMYPVSGTGGIINEKMVPLSIYGVRQYIM